MGQGQGRDQTGQGSHNMPPIAGLQGRRLRLGDQGSDTARWTGVPRIAPTKVFLDTGDFRMLNAATVCLRNSQMRLTAGGSLP